MISPLRKLLFHRKDAYQTLFSPRTRGADEVLADLKEFCYADKPTWDENQKIQDLREGRREVWLRIKQHLKLTDDQIDQMTVIDND